jgi:pimeloyl-ACP methyl ester carboxylesterase
MLTETGIDLGGGRVRHVYDTGAGSGELTVFWHAGTPNTGDPPGPLLPAAERLGVRWVGYDRPGYAGTPSVPGRDVASAAADVAGIADALGVDRFAVMGHSGGGPHALACAALLPGRVLAAVCGSGLAPLGAEGLDWLAGMTEGGKDNMRAAQKGKDALAAYQATAEWDPSVFTESDYTALNGGWNWLMTVVGKANEGPPDGALDDDIAYNTPWGFDPAQITVPVLVLHGGEDRMVPASHGEWLARHIPGAELWLRPGDGHLSVLFSAEAALEWLREKAGKASQP